MTFCKTDIAAYALLTAGCVQMAGDLINIDWLKGLGAATHASPAPKVFTAHQGFETFSSRFFLRWESENSKHSLELTPETYAAIKGPYNRRNAYGATIAYGPVLTVNPLTQSMFASASRFALCGEAPVLRELGIDPASLDGPVQVELIPRDPRSAGGNWQLHYRIDCSEETHS